MITSICLIIILLFISSAIHNITCQHKEREATINSGRHADRQGKVVSYWPFDLMVRINTSSTEEEQEITIQDCLKRNQGWKMPEEAANSGENVVEYAKNKRVWVRVWRWKAKIRRSTDVEA